MRNPFISFFAFSLLKFVFCLPLFAQSGDVTIKLNGGDNVVYIGEVNRLEIWISNDVDVAGIDISFQSDWLVNYRWIKPYGNLPDGPPESRRIQSYGDAIGAFDFTFHFIDRNDGVLPDTMSINASALSRYLPVSLPIRKAYDLVFFVEGWQSSVCGALCVDNIVLGPYSYWEFADITGLLVFVPSFQGIPNSGFSQPDAPAVCFDAVERDYFPGDADHNRIMNLADAVYLIAYIFRSGPMPLPIMAGDLNCDQYVDISDVVELVSCILAGSPAPCTDCK